MWIAPDTVGRVLMQSIHKTLFNMCNVGQPSKDMNIEIVHISYKVNI